jgi:cellulose synthase/poly-beta-1,6-N-acetylglucosamine synthase-like glycosyltransferase
MTQILSALTNPTLAALLFAAGLGILLVYHALKWQQDRSLALKAAPALQIETKAACPRVSVLVAAWNEGELIAQHIRCLLALRYPNKELVLCAGGRDQTYPIASSYAGENVIVLQQRPGEGKQKALQRCLEVSSGAIIFLTDADSFVDDAAFEQTIAPLVVDSEVAATGDIRPYPQHQTDPFVLQNWFISLYDQAQIGKYIEGVRGANAAIERGALEAAGGFAMPVKTGTDYYLAKQLLARNYRIRHVNSQVVSEFSRSLKTHYIRQSRWLRNVVLHGWRFGAYGEALRCLLPSAIGVFMWLGLLLAIWPGGVFLSGWLLILLHSLFSRVRYMWVGERLAGVRYPRRGFLLLPVFLWIDYTIWALTLLDYLYPRGRGRW